MNTHVRDNLNYLFTGGAGGADSARVHSLADHSLPNNGWELLPYNATRHDNNSNMAGSSGSTGLTFPVIGTYIIVMNVRFAASQAGRRGSRISSSPGGTVIAETLSNPDQSSSFAEEQIVTTIWKTSAASQIFRGEAFQDSGAALTAQYVDAHAYEYMAARIA